MNGWVDGYIPGAKWVDCLFGSRIPGGHHGLFMTLALVWAASHKKSYTFAVLFSHLTVKLIDKCDAFLKLLSLCFMNVPWYDGTLGLDPGCKSLNVPWLGGTLGGSTLAASL